MIRPSSDSEAALDCQEKLKVVILHQLKNLTLNKADAQSN
jgi:hypothetical protein